MSVTTDQAVLDRVPRARTVWVTFAFFVLFMSVGFPLWERVSEMPDEVRVLDLRFGYGPDVVYAVLAELGSVGRSAYVRSLTTLDVAWPLVYGAFLTVLPAYAFAHVARRRRRLIVAVPILGVVFDYLENVSILTLLARYPERIDALAWTAGTLTAIKWVFVSAAMLLAVGSLIALIRQRRAARAGQ